MKIIKNKERGMTLIELIVAIGIFGLVSLVIFGIFILATGYQRRIIAFKNVEDNLRFSIESMAREIRTGKDFNDGGNELKFTNAKGDKIIYRLNNGIIQKSSNDGISYLDITGTDTAIDYLTFSLMGQTPNDNAQPRITITIGATSKVGAQSSNLKVQTTVSSRLLQN
ncbi:MAG: type II secretion system protein [Candidatus Azambacteria bacterium]|nr:type II secretion system protein [Candidatus Azambacteria bacterium]